MQKKDIVQKTWFYSLYLSNAKLPGKNWLGLEYCLISIPLKLNFPLCLYVYKMVLKMQNTQEHHI